jgi:hypothetical protein
MACTATAVHSRRNRKGPARNSAGPKTVRNLSTRAARVSLSRKLAATRLSRNVNRHRLFLALAVRAARWRLTLRGDQVAAAAVRHHEERQRTPCLVNAIERSANGKRSRFGATGANPGEFMRPVVCVTRANRIA